jgi:hypothetical protein
MTKNKRKSLERKETINGNASGLGFRMRSKALRQFGRGSMLRLDSVSYPIITNLTTTKIL